MTAMADRDYRARIAELAGEESSLAAAPRYFWFKDLRDDPDLLRPPRAVLPRLAWEGRATLLSAQEKLGKSTLIGQAVAALVSGGEFLGQKVTRGPALWMALDEPLGDLVRREESFGVGDGDLAIVDYRPTHEELESILHEVRPAAMVIDCLSSYAAGQIENFRDANGWRWLLGQQLLPLTRSTGTAVILIHHHVRDGKRYADSREIGAAADFIIDLEGSVDSPSQRVVKGKGRGYPAEWSSYTLDYTSSRYHLAQGGLSIETRTLLAIQENPDSGKARIRSLVHGRNDEVDAAIHSLIRAGQVEDLGTGATHKYRIKAGSGRATTGQHMPEVG